MQSLLLCDVLFFGDESAAELFRETFLRVIGVADGHVQNSLCESFEFHVRMCLNENSHELIETIWGQGRNIWNGLTAQLNEVVLAAQITIDSRDGFAGDAASKDLSPGVYLGG